MRLATYNMENLFSRPAAMGYEDSSEVAEVLGDFDTLNRLIGRETYSDQTKSTLATLLEKYGYGKSSNKGAGVFQLNEIRGKLYKVPQGTQDVEIVADGRHDWVGWFDLVRDDINWPAISNTARVVNAVKADVLLAVEVEDRLTLERFNRQVLGEQFPSVAYPFNLLVDGNDTRGIDIGLYSRLPILGVRSHSHVEVGGTRVFSRDCPEFDIELSGGRQLIVLGNHLKSKGYGSPASTAARRLKQAREVKKIYQRCLARSQLVAVAGDLNETPNSDPIKALTTGTGLRDAMEHPSYTNGPDPRPGTYKSGNPPSSKIDYLLLSPQLWNAVTKVGVERRGIYAPQSVTSFPSVTTSVDQASDHAAVWADLNV